MIDIPARMILAVAFIMVVTYTVSGLVYADYDNPYDQHFHNFPTSYLVMDFPTWIQVQYLMAHARQVNGEDISEQPFFNLRTVQYIEDDYKDSMMGWDKSHNGIFDEFGTRAGAGLLWFNSDYPQGQGFMEWAFGDTRAELIENEYDDYKLEVTGEDKGDLIQAIAEFLGSVWNGFVQFVKVLSFTNIPNVPPFMYVILGIFFIPMWIILIVGLAPYVADFIRAIASFIDSIKPW